MFNFFGHVKKEPLPQLQHPPDALNDTATEVAIELIEGKGGEIYLAGMKRIFRKTPDIIDDVAPEYRERLKMVLEQEDD